jgi:hypothetical protein
MSEEKSDKWELPEPIFRRSDGEPVKPSEKTLVDPEPDTLDPGLAVDPDADTLTPDLPEDPQADLEKDMLELGPSPIHGTANEPDTLELELTDEPATEQERDAPEPEDADDPLAKLYAPPEGHVERPAPAPAPVSGVAVEPQPYVSEELSAEKIDVAIETVKPKGSMRPAMFALGLILLLLVAGGFVALIYFLFFAGRNSSSGF